MKTNFKDTLLASGFLKKKGKFCISLFGSVEVALLECDDNHAEDSFGAEWFVYLNDKPFSATMESAFKNDGDFFNAYMKRKLRKDTSGNLGMVMAPLSPDEDGKLCNKATNNTTNKCT